MGLGRRAAMLGDDLQRVATPISPFRVTKPTWAAEAFSDLDTDVRQSIARIQAEPSIPVKDSVRGFVYDVSDGSLREVV